MWYIRWYKRSRDSTCNDKSRKDNNAYEPETTPVTKDHGTPTTEDDVTGAQFKLSIRKGKPTIIVDDPSKLPDGNTGTSNVDVTVTYPDGTQDRTVPVTTNPEKQQCL